MKAIILRILYILFLTNLVRINYAQQNDGKFNLTGYSSSLQNAMFQNIDSLWVVDNLIHNRLNFHYSFNDQFTVAVELRNRLAFGESVTLSGSAEGNYSYDNGFIDLSKNIASGRSYILNSAIDRAWFAYESGKLKVTLGRQRINWGQTMVWNPNDIFNAYSFFDFDYLERPGSDALRFQYYNSEVSSTEFACKLDQEKKLTAAALYRASFHEFDIQGIGGILQEKDYVAGLGWSGAIKSYSFRGEASYFQPIKNAKDTLGLLLMSVSADHTFSNDIFILTEYLFSNRQSLSSSNILEFYQAPLTVKNIAIVKHSFLGQLSYPVTPLITTSFSFMYLLGIKGYYINPSVMYNLAENVDASLFYQGFRAKSQGFNQRINFLFLRVKWSF